MTVTVLRGSVDPRRVPFAITVLDATELGRGRAPTFLEHALEAIPGVQVQNRFNFAQGERLAVRGYGARAQFGVRGVRVIIDGVPATLPDGQTNLDVIDAASIGRVEVLRGPAAAIYGNGAGGVLVFETRAPPSLPLQPAARAVFGSHGLRTVDGAASGTVMGTGYLVSATRMEWTGFRTLASDPDQTYGAADRTGLNVRVLRPVGGGVLRVTALAMDQSGENPGSIPPSVFDTALHAWANNVRQRTGESSAQSQVGVSWSGPLRGVTGDVGGWLLHRETDGPIPTSILDLTRDGFGVRASLRDSGERWAWDAGASLERQSDDRKNFVNELGARGALTLDQLETVTAAGVFAQGRGSLRANLNLLFAVRWDRFRFEADDRLIAQGNPDDSGVRAMDAINPSAGIVWEPSPRLVLFGNLATSLETPTTTELGNRPDGAGGFNPELEPARGGSAELGVRGDLVGWLHYELLGFIARMNDELIAFEVPQAPGRTFYRNAGSSRHRGLEALLDVRPLPGFRIRAAHSRTAAEFAEYRVAGVDLEGKRLPGLAPARWEGVLGFERGPAYVEISGEWVDRIPVDDANSAYTPSHHAVGVRGGVEGWRLGRLEVGLFGAIQNLTDERYVSSVVVNAFGSRWFEPGPGRWFQLGVRTAWGER